MAILMPILNPKQVCTETAYPVIIENDTAMILRSEQTCTQEKSDYICDGCKRDARLILSSKAFKIKEV